MKRSNRAMLWNAWDILMALFPVLWYSDETAWRPQWKIPPENSRKHHFRDSKFQNVPRYTDPQELVRVSKPATTHY